MIYEKTDCCVQGNVRTTEDRHTNSVTLRVGGVSAPTEEVQHLWAWFWVGSEGRFRPPPSQDLSLGMGFCDEQTETRLRP